MVKLKDEEKVSILDRGSKPKKSTQQSALITNPANRPVLVAKLRDDALALRKAGFYVEFVSLAHDYEGETIFEMFINVIAPPGDKIGVSGNDITYNDEIVI